MSKISRSLFTGTILLLISNIIVKGLGFGYRVILVRLLGTEGIGLIEMVTPVYALLLVIAGGGVQLALSQITAKRQGENTTALFTTALVLLLIGGCVVTMVARIFAPFICEHFIADSRAYYCFVTILPAVLVISVASAFRGYFQGTKDITAIGSSQSIEQVVRVVIGVLLVQQFLGMSIERTITATSIASVCGETAGFIYLIMRMRGGFTLLQIKKKFAFINSEATRLLRFGAPVTLTRLSTTIIMMLQAILIPMALQHAGWDMRSATEMYGRFAGVAMTLLHLPGVFTSALVVAIVPAVAENIGINRGLLNHRINQSLQVVMIFTLPGMICLNIFADLLCSVIFKNPPAAQLLQILSWGGLFFYIQITLIGILQGLGEVRSLFYNGLISGFVLLAGIALLTPQPQLGINGAAIAVDIAWVCGCALNLLRLLSVSHIKLDWKNIMLKPLLAGTAATVLGKIMQIIITDLRDIEFAVVQGTSIIIIYLLILLLSGGFNIGWKRLFKR